jgi:isopentenyldiphosphate isomerase
MEYLDVCDAQGNPTGEIVARDVAHREGIRHRTAHVWVVRRVDGRWQVLLQKRSENKESFPGKYDTSSAGHIPAGDEPLESALRELAEELGIRATPDQLHPAGTFDIRYEKEFHGRLFRDNELSYVYVYMEPVDAGALTLQEEEVSRVDWFDLEKTWSELPARRDIFCVPTPGMAVLRAYLGQG